MSPASLLILYNVFLFCDASRGRRQLKIPRPDTPSPPAAWKDVSHVTASHNPKLNDPCDYFLYKTFQEQVVIDRNLSNPYINSVGVERQDHPKYSTKEPKYMDPKDLCMQTDAQRNFDMNEFDCLRNELDNSGLNGSCGCGSRWGEIDLNDDKSFKGLNLTTFSYEYFRFEGLSKLLVIDEKNGKPTCVAYRYGHCTLDQFKNRANWHVTECMGKYKCRNISVWSPISKSPIRNPNTGEWYGLCVSDKNQDKLVDPFAGGGNLRGDVVLITISLITVVNLCAKLK